MALLSSMKKIRFKQELPYALSSPEQEEPVVFNEISFPTSCSQSWLESEEDTIASLHSIFGHEGNQHPFRTTRSEGEVLSFFEAGMRLVAEDRALFDLSTSSLASFLRGLKENYYYDIINKRSFTSLFSCLWAHVHSVKALLLLSVCLFVARLTSQLIASLFLCPFLPKRIQTQLASGRLSKKERIKQKRISMKKEQQRKKKMKKLMRKKRRGEEDDDLDSEEEEEEEEEEQEEQGEETYTPYVCFRSFFSILAYVVLGTLLAGAGRGEGYPFQV